MACMSSTRRARRAAKPTGDRTWLLTPHHSLCMWPTCPEPIEFVVKGGRRRLFCSPTHRVAYFRERDRLLAGLQTSQQRATVGDAATRRAAVVDGNIYKWQLLRFPALDDGSVIA